MLPLFAQDQLAIASTQSCQHVEASVKLIASQLPYPEHDAVQSIRIGLRDVAFETARNIQQLSQETVEQALKIGQQLWRMQRDLKRKEYRTFLSIIGWELRASRKFINLAKTFDGFEVSQLIRLELTTLLGLCSSRYSLVVAKLRQTQNITQELVEQLIKQNRPPRKPKQDGISGWKQNRVDGGLHYEVILHDEETRLSIEQQAEAEGILPQRVIAEAVALRAQHKSSSEQLNEYVAAQLQELQAVVEHALSLDAENRKLVHELQEREHRIAELEAKLSERVVASSTDEVAMPVRACASRIASTELNEYLEDQVQVIAPEQITQYENTHLEPEPQVIHVGDLVEIVSSRQGAEFVWQIGVVKVANTVGCVVEILARTLWFCVDELVLVSASA